MIIKRENVDITDVEKATLAREWGQIIRHSETEAQALKGLAERAREFIAGNHTGTKKTADGQRFSYAKAKEMEDKNNPVVDVFTPEFAKICAYVIGRQSKPIVVAEDRVFFDEDLTETVEGDEAQEPENPMPELRELFAQAYPPDAEGKPTITDSELFERVGTARLDRFMERADWPRIMRMALMTACRERVVAVHLGYNQDEATREPLFISQIPAGDFGGDDAAPTYRDGRYMWRRERNVLAADVANDYGLEIAEVLKACPPGDTAANDGMPESMKYVTLMHVWRRNKETQEAGGDENTPAMSAYKYRGGWQYSVLLGEQVIFNGHSTDPSGEPPMEFAGMLEVPDAQYSLGMYDKIAAFNRVLDELMHAISESARKSLKKIAAHKTAVENPEAITDGQVKGVLWLKGTMPANQAIYEFDGGGASQEIMATFDRLLAAMRESLGTLGLNAEDFGSDPSGVMLEGLKQDRSGIIAGLIAPTFDAFAERILTRALNFMLEYEDVPTTLKVLGADRKDYHVAVNVGKFGMRGTDIQPAFDVKVIRSKDGIENPIKRAEYLTSMVKLFFEMLNTQGPEAAALWLESIDLPIRPQLRQFLQDMKKAEASAPAEGEPDPNAGKTEAEMAKAAAESAIKIKEMAAQARADALERMATGLINLGEFDRAAAVIASMPAEIQAAYTTEAAAPLDATPTPQDAAELSEEEMAAMIAMTDTGLDQGA